MTAKERRDLAVFLCIAVIAVAAPLGIDAISPLPTAGFFLISGGLVGVGLWLFMSRSGRVGRTSSPARLAVAGLFMAFCIGTALSVTLTHGVLKIVLALFSLAFLAGALTIIKREA